MQIFLFILMGITALVMITGVIFMVVGGERNRKYSNKLMVARVGFQAAALVCFALLLFAAKG